MPHFWRRGHRVELELLSDTFVMRGGSAVLRDLQAHLPVEVEELAFDAETGALVVRGHPSAIQEAVHAAGLGQQVRLDPTYRRVGGPPADLCAPTGRVSVRFPDTWDRGRSETTLARRGLRITEPIHEMPGGYFAVTEADPVEAARALAEEDGALFADPDFVRHMSLRASNAARAVTEAKRRKETP